VADIVFNVALGRVAYYGGLPATNDALIAVPIETSGIVADSTMRDYANLSALLAGASNEQTTMGRQTLGSVVVTVNNTSDRVEVDSTDITWLAATGNAISAIVICYDPDTTTGTDADLIPLTKHDYVESPTGSDIVATVTDFYRSVSAA
jgi:hypothetical protein